jgi:hypothetical protein
MIPPRFARTSAHGVAAAQRLDIAVFLFIPQHCIQRRISHSLRHSGSTSRSSYLFPNTVSNAAYHIPCAIAARHRGLRRRPPRRKVRRGAAAPCSLRDCPHRIHVARIPYPLRIQQLRSLRVHPVFSLRSPVAPSTPQAPRPWPRAHRPRPGEANETGVLVVCALCAVCAGPVNSGRLPSKLSLSPNP